MTETHSLRDIFAMRHLHVEGDERYTLARETGRTRSPVRLRRREHAEVHARCAAPGLEVAGALERRSRLSRGLAAWADVLQSEGPGRSSGSSPCSSLGASQPPPAGTHAPPRHTSEGQQSELVPQ
jgi:hypothetical protein